MGDRIMSKIQLVPNAAGTGTFTVESPNSNTNRTFSLPDITGTAAVLSGAQTFTAGQRGEITSLTDATSITIDLADSNNFAVTLEGNRTLETPSNVVAGQCGSMFIVQDGTGSRTLSFASTYKFIGGTAPTLSTAAGAIDRLDYIVQTSTAIQCVFTAAYS